MLNEKTFRKGSYLFLEGDEESGTVYLIKKGRVSHSCSSPMLSTALKDGREGDFIGFISSFSERPRISSAIAVEDTAAVQIDRDHFFRMLHEKHDIAMKIINSYSAVLKEYDNLLIDIKPISLLYPQSMSLLRLGEFYMENGDNILASYIFNRYIQLYPDSENITDVVKYLEDIESSSSAQPFKENDQGELFYNDKSVIFCEYEPGDNLYFIRDGKVKIIKQNKNRNILLAVLGPGDIFGELALIANAPRSATAISFGGAKLTPVDMDLFRELLSRSPEMIKKLLHQ